jgi:hypothetical protein
MSDETSITVNQEGVNSFAAALSNPQQYEIFIDDQVGYAAPDPACFPAVDEDIPVLPHGFGL